MSSLSNREKKRIARVGKGNSNEIDKSSNDDDVVSEIIKAMDSSMKYSRKNVISYKQLQALKNRDQTTPSTSHGDPSIDQQQKISSKQVKKYLPVKKHPLMEKCQKNLKHIKHNRSIPKQRAHVGTIQTFPKQVGIKSQSVNRLSKKENKEKDQVNNASKKVCQPRNLPSNFHNVEKTDTLSVSDDLDNQTSDLIKNNSSSESDFENFIRTQKEMSESDQSNDHFESSIKYKRKKKRSKKDLQKKSNSNDLKKNSNNERIYKKQTKCKQLGSVNTKEMVKDSCNIELDYERSRSTEVPLKRKFEDSDESDIDMSPTYGCDATLSDSDYSEISQNSYSAESLNVEKKENETVPNFNLSLDLNKEECKQYISKNFTCSVRIERNAFLDKEMLSSNLLKSVDDHEVPSIDENASTCYTDVNETHITSPEEIILDSDDECTVICEIQKPNVLSTSESRPLNSVICSNSLSSITQAGIPLDSSCGTKTFTPDSNCDHQTVISHSLPSLQTVTSQTSCDLPVAVTSFSTQTASRKIAPLNVIQTSSQVSERDSLDVELQNETVIKYDDTVEPTDAEFNVQILSVKSLGDSADYALSTYDLTSNKDDHRNSAELLDSSSSSSHNAEHNISKCKPSYGNNKQIVDDDVKQRNCNNSANLMVDATISNKDHFKYAKHYSKPRSFKSTNDNLASIEEVANDSSSKLTTSEYQVSSARDQNAGAIFFPKLDELLNKIDIETINKVIKQSPCPDDSPININNDTTASGQKIDIIPVKSKGQSTNVFDLSANDSTSDGRGSIIKPSLKSDILETVNKIDFNQVLFLAQSGNVTVPHSEVNSTPVSLVQNSLPSGEFLNETQQPSLILGSTENEPLPSVSENQIGSEMFWQHLKDAVTVDTTSLKESNSNSETSRKENIGISVEHQNACGSHDNADMRNAIIDLPKIVKGTHLSKPEGCSEQFQQNISHLEKTSSSDMSASYQKINSSQKEMSVSSSTDVQCRRSVNNIHERKFSEDEKELLLQTNAVKIEKRSESPSDELDVIATTSIREFSESKSESILPLFHIYKKELQQYHKIISAEKNVSAGLKMLEETQAKKLEHIEKAIHNLVKNDPCFYKVVSELQFGKTTSSVKSSILPREALKQEATVSGERCETNDPFLHKRNPKCDNCAQAANLKCLGCRKAYFCTVECGENYWKKGHYLNCS